MERPPQILYIENDVGIARLVQKRLQRAGYHVDLAHDGETGLNLASSGTYDLIAVDQSLPGYEGLEIIRILASHGPLPPTIMVTGNGDERIAVRVMKLGVSDYIVKDIDGQFIDLLPAIIERTLQQHHLLREREQARQQLNLQATALEATASAIVITDREGTILWANPAFVRLTGYTLKEALGQNPRILKSDQHDASFYKQMWRTILAGDAWRGELINQRKDGSRYREEMTITPVQDPEGNILRFIAVKQDITARKQAEEAQQQLSQELMEEIAKREQTEQELQQANERMNYLLRRFVPRSLAQKLINGHDLPSLGGERRTISVLFADVRGYTQLSEVLDPEEMMGLLNRHFAVIGGVIETHGGTISQYTGDMVMAMFNALEDQPDHALRAVRAGINLRAALLDPTQQALDGSRPIMVQFGVGINTGPAVVGYLGFEGRYDFTAVGDTINTAARLSADAHSGEILIGPDTFEAVRGNIRTRNLGSMLLKGKSNPVTVYEALGEMRQDPLKTTYE